MILLNSDMTSIYDTTKPSASFGGTFSPSRVVLLCVMTDLDLKPRRSLPPLLDLEAVPRGTIIQKLLLVFTAVLYEYLSIHMFDP